MRKLVFLIPFLALPVAAQEAPLSNHLNTLEKFSERLTMAKKLPASEVKFIDAKTLSTEQLNALAAAERANPTAFSCCDWGGGCFAYKPES